MTKVLSHVPALIRPTKYLNIGTAIELEGLFFYGHGPCVAYRHTSSGVTFLVVKFEHSHTITTTTSNSTTTTTTTVAAAAAASLPPQPPH